MTSAARAWDRVSIVGKVVLITVPLLLVLGIAATVALVVVLPTLLDALSAQPAAGPVRRRGDRGPADHRSRPRS